MEKNIFLIDAKTGIEYLENLPEGYVKATIDDFHVHGKKRIGMKYFLQGTDWKVFFQKEVTESLTGAKLKPFIDNGQVYVKK